MRFRCKEHEPSQISVLVNLGFGETEGTLFDSRHYGRGNHMIPVAVNKSTISPDTGHRGTFGIHVSSRISRQRHSC